MVQKRIRVALYERVSRETQHHRSQHAALEAYCRRQGWKNPRVYQEKLSRDNPKRTVLNQLLEDARGGKIDVVVIYRMDRLGSRPVYMLQVVEELKHLKIRFISVGDHIDTEDKSSKAEILLGFMSTIAGAELSSIRQRTRDGIAAARKRGMRIGRPPLDPAKSQHVRELIMEGLTTKKINAKTGVSLGKISQIRNAKQKPA